MKQKHKLWIRSIIIALSSILLAAVLQLTGAFDAFENKTYDLRMVQAAEYKTPCDEIAFIVVDQESISWAKETYGWSWPWPREAYGRIINFFSAGNPEAIAFDILYTEPSVYGESDDIALGEAEAKSKKVIQTLFYSPSDYDEPLPPVTPIYENAALLGNITSSKDKDDIIRRSRIVDNIAGKDYPTLGLAPLFLNEEKPDFSNLPLLDDGTVLLRFTKTIDDYHPYSAKSILESYDQWLKDKDNVDRNEYFVPEDFDGLYIFGAYYAPGLFDICSTPVSQVYPGVGVHITALDNYLTDSFIRKVPVYVSIIWMVLLAFLATLIVAVSESKFPRFSTIIISAGIVIGIAVAIIVPVILFDNGMWIYLVSPLFAFILSGVTSLLVSLSVEGKQKRFIRSAFSQCLSKDVVNQIINDASSFTLGGKKFQMSAIFTDIQKFSSFSELLTASELGCLLNFYLTKMSDIIIDDKGTVDKYEGDAIVALVGAPVAMDDHASHACSAAIKMKKAEQVMNEDIIKYAAEPKPSWMEDDLYSAFKTLVANGKTIFTRIGINSGEMIAGYFGSEKKKNYTMMGNNVNLASRLEGVNKQYHTNGILISQATRELLGDDFAVRSLDRVRVVNINTPIQLYEVIDEKKEASPELLKYIENWEAAMKEFTDRNYSKAKELLSSLLNQKKDDHVAEYYIHLLDDYFLKGNYPKEADSEGVEFNPEDGVFKLLQK
ncbi:MAG: adenylate/guanylate cyclase domain-containing protein [Treponema sp.]|uniref:CHASE2 domain-containing protein n=1 Tax=Treponema sp. TaxID=166 RepID=UPI00298E5373|nr:adenylate/guanylate cyclase domain-containing protein [Treponema sp.]MCQ2600870.1 adenylate/guanylate cyclase domain-containing protein [Treponema sp.]